MAKPNPPERQAAAMRGDKTYFIKTPCKRGHVSPRFTATTRCVECGKGYSKKNNARFDVETKRLMNLKLSESRKLDPVGALLITSRHRAKKRGLPHTIRREDILIPDVCPITLLPLVFRVGHENRLWSMSLDRVDSSKGYVPGNVAVISLRANFLKSNGTLEEFKRMINYIETNSP